MTADRFGRNVLVVSGMAGSGAFAVVAAVAAPLSSAVDGDYLGMLVVPGAFLVLALTFSPMQTGAVAFGGDLAAERRESELMGLLSTAKGLGGISGPVILGAVATATSYAVAFVAGSLLAVSGAALVAVGLVAPKTNLNSSTGRQGPIRGRRDVPPIVE